MRNLREQQFITEVHRSYSTLLRTRSRAPFLTPSVQLLDNAPRKTGSIFPPALYKKKQSADTKIPTFTPTPFTPSGARIDLQQLEGVIYSHLRLLRCGYTRALSLSLSSSSFPGKPDTTHALGFL